MADKTTGELQAIAVSDLSAAPDVYDDLLIPAEHQSKAVSVSGAQFKKLARVGVETYVEDAKKSSEEAMQAVEDVREIAASVEGAGAEAARAEAAAEAAEQAREAAEQARNEAQAIAGGDFLPLAGGVLTGPLTLHGDPSENLHAAPKQYVDNKYNELFTSVSDGKTVVASAVTDMGVETADDATFAEMAENIRKIQTGVQLPELTNPASAADLLEGKQLIDQTGEIVEGSMPSVPGGTITPGASEQVISGGRYLLEDIIISAVTGKAAKAYGTVFAGSGAQVFNLYCDDLDFAQAYNAATHKAFAFLNLTYLAAFTATENLGLWGVYGSLATEGGVISLNKAQVYVIGQHTLLQNAFSSANVWSDYNTVQKAFPVNASMGNASIFQAGNQYLALWLYE